MIAAWKESIARALAEDIGRGDITTDATVEIGQQATAELTAKEDLVVCGLTVMVETFHQVNPAVMVEAVVEEGAAVASGDLIARVRGSARGILVGERVALNFMQNLSAVASLTREFIEAVEGTGVRIVDTRKTTPGLRLMQKYAVRVGGGFNHRLGLDDGILIKDNHIAMAGGVERAVSLAKAASSHLNRVEVEVKSLEQIDGALAAGADVILLDNMSPEVLKKAVEIVKGRAFLEASGGISLETVRAVAETGVDMISAGFLTHSAGSRDISLNIVAN